MIITIRNSAELQAALNTAEAGQTLVLKDGVYSPDDLGRYDFSLKDKSFGAQGLTITSETPLGAEIRGGLLFSNVEGVSLQGLTLAATEPTTGGSLNQASASYAVHLAGARDVTFAQNKFIGFEVTQDSTFSSAGQTYVVPGSTGNFGGYGVWLRNTHDVTLEQNEFTELFTGISFVASQSHHTKADQTSNTLILDNYIHNMRSEGIRGTDHIGTVVRGNVMEDFNPYVLPTGGQGDHPDMIQFWGFRSQFGVQDFTIEQNLFYEPDDSVQVIFGHMNGMSDAERAKISFSDFKISDNVIVTGSFHGISLSSVQGGEVTNNTLLPNALGSAPQIYLASSERPNELDTADQAKIRHTRDLEVSGNITSGIYNEGVIIPLHGSRTLDELGVTGIGFNTDLSEVWRALNITDANGATGPDNLTYDLSATSAQALADLFANAQRGDDNVTNSLITGQSAQVQGFGSSLSRDQGLDDLLARVVAPWQDGAPRPQSSAASSSPTPTTQLDDDTISQQAQNASPTGDGQAEEGPLTPPQDQSPQTRPDPAAFDQVLTGAPGTSRDKLIGGSGNDFVTGGAGADVILGKAGDDYIIAGAGKDSFVVGGTGQDTFEFSAQSDDIKIADFEVGVDQIALAGGLEVDDFTASTFVYKGNKIAIFEYDADGHNGAEARLMFSGLEHTDVKSEDFVLI